MSTEIKIPDIGDFQDVPVIELLVAVGDEVEVETPLLTLESDKATIDVPASVAGKITEILVKLGDRVSAGTAIVKVEPTPGVAADDAPAADTGRGKASSAGTSSATSDPAAPTSTLSAAKTTAGDGGAGASLRSPAATAPPSPAATGAPSASYDTDVLVIGAGPGGYTAAFRAADLGLRTTLVERHARLGGVCLNVGCIPSKALLHAAKTITDAEEMAAHGISFGKPKVDLRALLEFKDGVVTQLTDGLSALAKRRKVDVVRGEAVFSGPHSVNVGEREISFANAIVAVGSRPVKLPFIPDDPRVIDSTGALSPTEIPKRMLVIGGGVIGLEMACVYDALGTEVSVVEMVDQLIPGADKDIVKVLQARISKRYKQIMTDTEVKAVKAQKDGLKVEFSSGESHTYDRVLVAVGRVPNGRAIAAEAAGVEVDERGFIAADSRQRTNVPHIYAIGDVVGQPMLAHKATHEAKVAAEAIAGHAGAQFDAQAIPAVAYTDPEVAWMGLTEAAAKAGGIKYEKQSFPWAASGRALGLGRTDGVTKLLFEPETNRLLGAAVAGVGAGDLIAEAVLALEAGLDAEDIALSIHPHPTLSETIAFAAEMQDGSITDLMGPRKRQ